jgi:hypothetical protein
MTGSELAVMILYENSKLDLATVPQLQILVCEIQGFLGSIFCSGRFHCRGGFDLDVCFRFFGSSGCGSIPVTRGVVGVFLKRRRELARSRPQIAVGR